MQARIIEDFAPRFAQNSIVLYLGETAKKIIRIEEEIFDELEIEVSEHDKLPDVVLLCRENNRLFLIEAGNSHGPVRKKSMLYLEIMLTK